MHCSLGDGSSFRFSSPGHIDCHAGSGFLRRTRVVGVGAVRDGRVVAVRDGDLSGRVALLLQGFEAVPHNGAHLSRLRLIFALPHVVIAFRLLRDFDKLPSAACTSFTNCVVFPSRNTLEVLLFTLYSSSSPS
jgi:hypothetical protein